MESSEAKELGEASREAERGDTGVWYSRGLTSPQQEEAWVH